MIEFNEGDNIVIKCPFSYHYKNDILKDSENLLAGKSKLELDTTYGPFIGLHAHPDIAQAEGKLELIVRKIIPIKGYQTRIAFIKNYYDPNGKLISYQKNKLHIKSIGRFRQLCRGWSKNYRVEGIEQ